MNNWEILACKKKRREQGSVKYNAIVLLDLYQTKLSIKLYNQREIKWLKSWIKRSWNALRGLWLRKCVKSGLRLSVMPANERSQETEIRIAVNWVVEFIEMVHIDHQKICMTPCGYNQVLVLIDHFSKYAEVVPCITASAEKTYDHLINTWKARHECPITFWVRQLYFFCRWAH